MTNSRTGASLEIHLLGQFCVAVDGRQVEQRRWSRRKAGMLIKLLALNPQHALHQDQVMHALWPDTRPEAAPNKLNKIVHMVRALEPELQSGANSCFILRRSSQIFLQAPGGLSIDVDQFERAAAVATSASDPACYLDALALYTGDLLPEDLYEDWPATRRERLRRLCDDLLWKLSRIYEGAGAHEAAIDQLNDPPAHFGMSRRSRS